MKVIKIIFKFVLKNISEKKFRTFLIVFSIMISSALFFASNAISGTMGKMYTERMKQYYGSADLIIRSGEKSPSPFFYTAGAHKHREYFDYIAGSINSSAAYKYNNKETINISLIGADLSELKVMNPYELYKEYDVTDFSGRKIVLGKTTSEKYNLREGDFIDLDLHGRKLKLLISAIAQPSGFFVDDGMSTYAVVPRDLLASLYNARGRVSTIYLKLKNPELKEEAIKKLSEEYPRYSVSEPFSQDELEQQMGPMSTSLGLMTIIVFFMSVFIIYSSFKVVTMERLPVIGTFRSIGATRRMTDLVLLTESLMYGILGGIIGCGLGIGILYIISYLTKPVWMEGFKATIDFSPMQLIGAFVAAVILSMVSSIIPIIKVSKISVKDIVLNSIEKKHKKKTWKLVLSLASLFAAVIIPPIVPPGQAMVILVFCMLLSIISVVMLIPYVTNLLVKVLETIYQFLFGNEGVLAVKNLRDNKSIFNNISLLAIGISSLLMINIISFSVSKEVVNVYGGLKYDLWISTFDYNRNFDKVLRTVDGVTSTFGVYEANNISVVDKNSSIQVVHGIDINKYPEYWEIHIEGNDREVLQELATGRNILLSNSLKERFGVKKGDTLNLNLQDNVKDYKVTGFFNTLMYNGDYAVVPERFLKADMKLPYYSQFFIKARGAAEDIEKNIKNRFPQKNMWITTMDSMEEMNMQSNNQMFAILNGFSVMALIIGIFGVLNNFIISFIERKRSLAVFRSIGMEKKQTIKMLFIESLTGGIIGGMAGIIAGLLLLMNTGYIMKAMSLPVAVHYSFILFLNSMLGGIIITLIASISPALKSSRLNIIESIKYE